MPAAQKPIQKIVSKQIVSLEDLGKVDINFPEFCFGIIGKIPQKNQPAQIIYNLKNSPDSKITITRSALGFPDQTSRDILQTLMRLTFRKNRFESPDVPCTLNEIMDELGWKKGGSHIKTLKKHLDILLGASIKFENSFFDKNQKKIVKEVLAFGVLDGYWFREIKSDGKLSGKESRKVTDLDKGFVSWNSKYFNQSLLTAKNLIDFDYTFYLSLEKDITKQLFLYLSKRSYGTQNLRIPLEEMAFTVLGMSASLKGNLSKVRFVLRDCHKQLLEKGFLPYEPIFQKDYNGCEYIIYKLRSRKGLIKIVDSAGIEMLPNNTEFEAVKSILTAFGATDGQVARLIKRHPSTSLLEALKQIQLQYPQRSKVKNIVGLVSKLMEEGADLSLAEDASKKEMEAEQRRIEEQRRQKELEIENQKKVEEQAKLESRIDAWIGANMLEFARLTEFFIDNRVKPNPVLKMFMDKEMERSGVSPSVAVMSHASLKSLLREEVGKIVIEASVSK